MTAKEEVQRKLPGAVCQLSQRGSYHIWVRCDENCIAGHRLAVDSPSCIEAWKTAAYELETMPFPKPA